jgi:hypothetical protein
MSFTEKVRGTYGFLEQTLSDRTMVITNATTRKMLQNELVLVDGIFGNVLEHNGIAGRASGKISINADRTIKTNQLASGAAFTVGATVYAVAGTNDAPVGLTHVSVGNTPVGVCVEIDPATTQLYVVFRPFIQPVDITAVEADVTQLKADVDVLEADVATEGSVLKDIKDNAKDATYDNSASGLTADTLGSAIDEVEEHAENIDDAIGAIKGVGYTDGTLKTHEDRLDTLEANVALNPMKVAEIVVDADASAGLAFANAATGLAVGDKIVDIIVRADAANAAGTAKVTHGGVGGADITDAISNVAEGTIGRAGKIVDGVITADGLVVTTDDATTKCTVYVSYIPA